MSMSTIPQMHQYSSVWFYCYVYAKYMAYEQANEVMQVAS